ncbi:MAG TPA: universal stress protein [Candidatus Aquicultor sp.]|jgi:nucleotide-binding universal stress UspA family protein
MRERPAVIVPLDGSGIATNALGAAQAMARIMNAVLYIVHVTGEPLSEMELIEHLKLGQLNIKDFSLHQIIGSDVVDGVLRFAAGVDTKMIVMSSHGYSYNPEHLVGSKTFGVVTRAVDPVMVIRPDMKFIPDASWTPRKMVVPQDGTPTAAAVMDQVFRLAELTGAEVDVLNIGVMGEKRPVEPGTLVIPQYLDHPRYDWPAWASEFVERFYKHRPPGIDLRLFEREGSPAQVMNSFALENGDDLIAIGWHGHFEEQRAPIVKELLQIADEPVVLIWSRE